MKHKEFVVALLCFFVSFGATAQQNSVYIGANGGLNGSKLKFTEDLSELYSSTNQRAGLQGGVTAGAEIHNFTISTGLNYVQKGGKYETNNFETNQGTAYFSAREKLHFLSVPILVGYRKYFGEKVAFAFAMGPSINFGLGGKLNETTEYFGSEAVDIQNHKVYFGNDINDDYKGTQIGFQVSPGIVVKVNDKSKINFNVTWDIGTSDSFNPRYKDANDFFDFYKGNQLNRSTMVSIGYEYHFSFGDKY